MLKELLPSFSKRETLHESGSIEIIEENQNIMFKPKRNRQFTLFIGESERYSFSDKLSFSREHLEKENAALLRNSRKVYEFGDERVNTGFIVSISEEQLSSFKDIKIDRTSIFESTRYSFEVFKGDNWNIVARDTRKNVPNSIELVLREGYPNITIEDVVCSADKEHWFDLTRLQRKNFSVNVPEKLDGEIKVGSGTFSIDYLLNNRLWLSEVTFSQYYCSSAEELDEKISRWNNHGLKVIALPDSFSPIVKEYNIIENNDVISFEIEEFTELATLEIEYPDNVRVAPTMRYSTVLEDEIPVNKLRGKYGSLKATEENTYENDMVIPSEVVRVHHRNGVQPFEEGVGKIELNEGEKRKISQNLTPRKKILDIKVSGDSVNININGEWEQLDEGKETKKVPVEDNNKISVKNGPESLGYIELTKEQLIDIKEVAIETETNTIEIM